MTRLWDELEGEQLAGGYGLRHYLGSEGESAFFETAFGPDERRALLKVTPDTPAGEEQLARWRSAFELSNPHLLAMLDCGRAEAGGDSYLYAVFEFPDDNLAGALAGGALSEAETREVLVAALEALRYLHGQNMVHGAVDAGHVVAVGDRIKLSSDTVHASGHFAGNGAAAADDVRALGTLLYRMRTGRKIEPGAAPELIGVADPLATIIRHALEPDAGRRWSVREIDAALNPPAPVAEPPVAEKPAPEPALEPPFLVRALPKRSPALPLLLAAVGAVAIAVVLAVTQRSTPDAPTPAITPVAAAHPAPAPNPPAPSAPAATATAIPVTVPEPARGVAHRAVARSQESWRVIAFTYNHRQQAEHKMQTINRNAPGFRAVVFAPRGADQPPFFVALGGRMSREQALALQKKARSGGLPRDTFVRNFSY